MKTFYLGRNLELMKWTTNSNDKNIINDLLFDHQQQTFDKQNILSLKINLHIYHINYLNYFNRPRHNRGSATFLRHHRFKPTSIVETFDLPCPLNLRN